MTNGPSPRKILLAHELQPGHDNLLELQRPDSLAVEVERFAQGHAAMWLRFFDDEALPMEIANVVFSGVHFYDGPLQFVGANLSVASHEECWSLIESLGWTVSLPNFGEYGLRQSLRLYTFSAQNPIYRVRMLASSAQVYNVPPIHLSGR